MLSTFKIKIQFLLYPLPVFTAEQHQTSVLSFHRCDGRHGIEIWVIFCFKYFVWKAFVHCIFMQYGTQAKYYFCLMYKIKGYCLFENCSRSSFKITLIRSRCNVSHNSEIHSFAGGTLAFFSLI